MIATTSSAAPRARAWLTWLASARAWLFLVILLAFFEIWALTAYGISFTFTVRNLQSIAVYTAIPLLLALGQTLVIISGGIDLSVGFTMGLAAVIMAVTTRFLGPQVGPELALAGGMAAAFAVAAVPGLINGVLIARLRVPPFIGTLGMYGVARGAAFLAADGTTVPVSNPYLTWLGNGRIAGVLPVPVVITIVVVLITHWVLSQTRFGQYTYALGGNRQAAIRAGIQVPRHTISLYLLAALFAAIAGIIYTGRFTAGSANAGEPLLLISIAAVVIGGASLFGGSGTIIGTMIGALTIAVIEFGLVFINVESFWQFILVGVVIVISVLVDQSQKRLSGGIRDD